ncbi:MAG: radical SAM/SPASM domain-containing protein [Rhodospirillales bacterium]|nr:MAG: radical SAM/SPASM domain-containing protein [Rhodospirillales bacterium]
MSYTPINKGQHNLDTPEREEAFERRRGYGNEADYAQNRRQWSEYPKKQFVSNYPLHVDLELASVCNLKCPMCYTITDEFKSHVNATLMDFELFKRLVDECAKGGVYSIRLSFRGEAFLHKKIVECVAYAKERGIREVSSLTNGLRIDEEMFEKLMRAGLDWLTISVDGMDATYEKIRRPAKFDRLKEKLGAFMRIREAAGMTKPALKVQGIFPAIANDPQAYYDVMAPLCDLVATNPLIDYLRNDDANQILFFEDFCCPQPFQRLVIAADGKALGCSNDENNEFVVGDVNSQTIHQIWHGKGMSASRDAHIRHQGCKEIPPCRYCYLPRKTETMLVSLRHGSFALENYVNRPQDVGA